MPAQQGLGRDEDMVRADGDVIANSRLPELSQPIDRAVLFVQVDDLVGELRVVHRAQRGPAGLSRVESRWGELQGGADRLDPEGFAMRVDVGDYFGCRRSSSAMLLCQAASSIAAMTGTTSSKRRRRKTSSESRRRSIRSASFFESPPAMRVSM